MNFDISPEELEVLTVMRHRQLRQTPCSTPLPESLRHLAPLGGKMVDRGLLMPVPCACGPNGHLVPTDIGVRVMARATN